MEKFKFQDEEWIITFFIAKGRSRSKKYTEGINSQLNMKKRELILKLKEYRMTARLKRDIPSTLIYDAVLRDNITSVQSFKKYIQKQRGSGKS